MHFRRAAVLSLLLAVSTVALAQKNEVSLSVGALATSDQTIQLQAVPQCPAIVPNCAGPFTTSTSTGVTVEGDYVRRILNFHIASVGAEFPVVYAPSRDGTTTGPFSEKFSVTSLFFTPSALIRFLPSGHVSPFFSFGGGLAHYESGRGFNRGAFQFGGGVDFKTHLPHLGLRLEVRDFWARGLVDTLGLLGITPDRQHNVFGGGGVVFKF